MDCPRPDALALREEALALRQRALPPDHPDIATAMFAVADSMHSLSRLADALALREEALALRKRALPPDHPDVAMGMVAVGNGLRSCGRYVKVMELAQEALALCRQVLPRDDPRLADALDLTAQAHSALEQSTDALKLFEEAIAHVKRVLPPDHPRLACAMVSAANGYSSADRDEEAEQLFEAALELRQRLFPEDHRDVLASMAELGVFYCDTRLNKAVQLQRQVLKIQKRKLPAAHRTISYSMSNLAYTLREQKHFEEALELSKAALAINKEVLPEDHPEIARSTMALAMLYFDEARTDEATRLQEEALAHARRTLPKDRADIYVNLSKAAMANCITDDFDKALELREEVLAFWRQTSTGIALRDEKNIVQAMEGVALSYYNLDRFDEALKLELEVLAMRERILPPNHKARAASMFAIASSLHRLKRHDEAVDMHRMALEFRKKHLSPDNILTTQSMHCLAEALSDTGRHEESVAMYKEAVANRKHFYPAAHEKVVMMCLNGLAVVLAHRLGRYREAIPHWKEALKIALEIFPENDARVGGAMDSVCDCLAFCGRHAEAVEEREKKMTWVRNKAAEGGEHVVRWRKHLADTASTHATSLSAVKRYEEALALRQEVVEIRHKLLNDEYFTFGGSMGNLAAAYAELERYDEALKVRLELLAYAKEKNPGTPEGYAFVAQCLSDAGRGYSCLHKRLAAVKMQEESVAVWRERVNTAVGCQSSRNDILPRGVRRRKMVSVQFLTGEGHNTGSTSPLDYADCLESLSRSYYDLGRHADVMTVLKEVISVRLRHLPAGHADIKDAMWNLQMCRDIHTNMAFGTPGGQKRRPKTAARRVKPNELCPCGSRKKYKKCCQRERGLGGRG